MLDSLGLLRWGMCLWGLDYYLMGCWLHTGTMLLLLLLLLVSGDGVWRNGMVDLRK